VHSSVPCTIPDSAEVCYKNPEGISNLQSLGSNIFVYPNPVNTVLFVKSTEDVHVSIYSVDGKALLLDCFVPRNDARGVSVERYAKGVYFVQVTFADGSKEVRKVVKE
jgi:hypothetical protein